MSKLERKYFKPFGINANDKDISQFGGANSNTKDVEEIINLDAWSTGWRAGVISTNNNPSLQQRNAVDYTFSYQLAYLLNEGVPEWNATTSYSKGAIVKSFNGTTTKLYTSLIDNNIGNSLTVNTAWSVINPDVNILQYPQIVNFYCEGSSGYIVYSNGFCKQWGKSTISRDKTKTITLLKSYLTTDFNIIACWNRNTNMDDNIMPAVTSENTIKFYNTEVGHNDGYGSGSFTWQTWGMLAEGEY